MIDTNLKRKTLELLGTQYLPESNQNMISHTLESAVQAAQFDNFEKLNSEIQDLLTYLDAHKLEQDDQQKLAENLITVIKELVPGSSKLQKIKASDFKWSPTWTIRENNKQKISKNQFKWS